MAGSRPRRSTFGRSLPVGVNAGLSDRCWRVVWDCLSNVHLGNIDHEKPRPPISPVDGAAPGRWRRSGARTVGPVRTRLSRLVAPTPRHRPVRRLNRPHRLRTQNRVYRNHYWHRLPRRRGHPTVRHWRRTRGSGR